MSSSALRNAIVLSLVSLSLFGMTACKKAKPGEACKKKGEAHEQKKFFHTFINSASFAPTTFSISATALSVSF
jgi:hypothetical protein